MKFFQKCAGALAHERKGLMWVSPIGLPVLHKYTEWAPNRGGYRGVTEFLAKPFGFKDFKTIVLRAMDQVDEADREEVFAAKRAS